MPLESGTLSLLQTCPLNAKLLTQLAIQLPRLLGIARNAACSLARSIDGRMFYQGLAVAYAMVSDFE
jgi:hypothetical protein